LGEETLLLARAVDARNRGNPSAALARLDEYRARFPEGSLADEAMHARVEVLVELGRSEEAISAIEDLRRRAVAGSTRWLELEVLRAELLVQIGRPSEALGIFDGLIDASSPAVRERAVYARSTCHFALGDAAQGRADLVRYLKDYPDGRFAKKARARLEK